MYMSHLLSADIWAFIAEHLCYVDKIALRLVCKKMHRIKFNFKQIILNKLGRHIDNPLEIYNFLSPNTIISGPFILACLYDTSDYDSIDIFDMQIKMSQNLFQITPTTISYYMGNKYKASFFKKPIFCYEYEIRHSIFRCVILDINPQIYIYENIDMDTWKSYYDGTHLRIIYLDKLITRKPLLSEAFQHNIIKLF